MTKIITFLILIIAFNVNAQYSFVKTNEGYINLDNPISINNGEVWDDPAYTINLPFEFAISNVSSSTIEVQDSYFGFVDSQTDIFHLASPLGIDLIDRGYMDDVSLSSISYEIVGNVGSRICKIEWTNAGAYNDENLSMFVNFQVWLYETSNIIEYRYGSSMIDNLSVFFSDETGGWVMVGKFDSGAFFDDSVFLSGDADNPITTNIVSYINGFPSETTIYRFTPTTMSLPSQQLSEVQLYPNPAVSFINVEVNDINALYQIIDVTGKIVRNGSLDQLKNQINIHELDSGFYILQVNGYLPQKFIKK
jgi:hypothetical protein